MRPLIFGHSVERRPNIYRFVIANERDDLLVDGVKLGGRRESDWPIINLWRGFGYYDNVKHFITIFGGGGKSLV